MSTIKKYSFDFYQAIGKLFYAIASADKNVEEEEYHKFKDIVKKEWVLLDNFGPKDVYQIKIVFDWLNKNKKLNPEKWFKDFLIYKNNNEKLFTNNIKTLILKTVNAIAYSFSSINKSELIMIAKLNLEFKKQIQKNEK
ncbi:hypothetical protein SAMN05428642_102640 [Flaviramulus basaltis]|uniref:Co-chaperone DjlA N-terminal domain-containing protein n=1 Tax=Flaviramulus basaltis TaxID=369401 RepID=A0A1K2IIS6_9FLAO|nr:hypothetical protein [Flaviramulus basaltis]SFZ92295.1 hypothetical protein SAMN05428642_102640 [Flaviramulus basaltis]